MKILVLAGAGTSIELGVPGMVGMANEFLDHSRQWSVSPELVQKLTGSPPDIEHLIEGLDRICSARSTLEAIGSTTEPPSDIEQIRAEVEWFVQHVAERVVARDAQLMWGSVLRVSRDHQMTFATTNYDRAIELAANAEKISLDDGFDTFGQHESAPWTGFNGSSSRSPLVKLHGSTDWYAEDESAAPKKLRHPMPLFGRSALRLSSGQTLSSALILPSREKLLTRAPYPRLSQVFLNAGDSCDFAVMVGSSLRDPHIRDATQAISQRVPVFVVNPEGSNYSVAGAAAIPQCASTFLISTFPTALASSNPIEVLQRASQATAGDAGILPLVRQVLSTDIVASMRCKALDELDNRGATLAPDLLTDLINDTNPTIARYSLGLVMASPVRDLLVQSAGLCNHHQDPSFKEDLVLLQRLISAESEARSKGVLTS